MPSISSSNKREVLKIENLSLKFQLKTYQAISLKDVFVNFFDPDHEESISKLPPRDVIIADKLNLTINEGDRVALLGVNGSGKTSLCRCISGTYKPDAGSIKIDGLVRAIFDVSVGIDEELTGRENALLMSAFLYPAAPDREKLVEDALAFTELGEFLNAPIRTYSRGMRSRFCLALVSTISCDLLILDEVFEGADQFFREKISQRMINMIDRSGACIFVSHAPSQIDRVCNRAVVVGQGKVLFDGDVQEALKFYNSAGTSDASFR